MQKITHRGLRRGSTGRAGTAGRGVAGGRRHALVRSGSARKVKRLASSACRALNRLPHLHKNHISDREMYVKTKRFALGSTPAAHRGLVRLRLGLGVQGQAHGVRGGAVRGLALLGGPVVLVPVVA
jgi:hypothetical protein